MAQNDVKLEINLDIKKVKEEFNNLIKQLQKNNEIDLKVKFDNKNLNNYFSNLNECMSAVDKNLNKMIDKISSSYEKIGKQTIDVPTLNTDKFEYKISELQNKLNSLKSNSLIDTSVISNLQNRLNSINTNTSEREVRELQNCIKNLGSSETQIVSLQNTIEKLGLKYNTVKNDLSKGNLIKTSKAGEPLEKDEQVLDKIKKIQSQIAIIKAIKTDMKTFLAFIKTPLGGTVTALAVAGATAYNAYEAYESILKKPTGTTSTEDLTAMEKVVNSLTGNIIKSKEELQKAGLVYEDFGVGTSDSFKNKIEDMSKSYHAFNIELSKAEQMDHIDIKDNTSGKIKGMVDNIVGSTEQTIIDKRDKKSDTLSKLFTEDDGKIDDNESEVLGIISEEADSNLQKVSEIHQQIYDTWNKAIEDHGKLGNEDVEKIRNYMQQIQQIQAEASAENNQDFFYIQEKLKSRVEGLSVDEAVEQYNNSNNELKDGYAGKRAVYENGMSILNQQREELIQKGAEDHKKEIELIDQQIAEKSAKYDELIKEEKQKRSELIKAMVKINPNLDGEINEVTGQKMNEEDKSAYKDFKKVKDNYGGMEDITESGMKQLKNEKGELSDVYVEVDEETKTIVGLYDTLTHKAVGYTQKNIEDINKAYNDNAQNLYRLNGIFSEAGSFQDHFVDGVKPTIDSAGNFKANDDILGQVTNLTTNDDGTRQGSLDLNGQEIVFKTNTDGVVTNLDEIAEKLNLMNDQTITINDDGTIDIIDCKLDDTKTKVDELNDSSATPEVNSDTSQANSNLDGTQAKLDGVNNTDINKDVNINTSSANSGLQEVVNKISYILQHPIDSFKNFIFGIPIAGAHAKGTKNAQRGINELAEEGFEIVVNRQYKWLNGGEQVLNHNDSVKVLNELMQGSHKSNADENFETSVTAIPLQSQSTETITVPNDIYQGNQGNSEVLQVNKADTLDKPYVSDYVDTSNMSKEEKKAYEKKRREEQEEKKALRDKEEKERQYLQDIGSAWDLNSKSLSSSISKIELAERELGENITYSQKIDLLNQKYQAQISLLDDAEKQLNTYNQASVTTEKAQEDLNKRIQSANETIIKQKKSIVQVYNEMNKYKVSIIKDLRDRVVDALKKEIQSEQEELEKLNEEKRNSKISKLDKQIEKLRKELAELDDDSVDKRKKLEELQKELADWSKDDSTESTKKKQELNSQIDDLEKQIKKDKLNDKINDLEEEKKEINDAYNEEREENREKYKKMIDDRNVYNQANKMLIDKNVTEIEILLASQEDCFKDIGILFGKNLAEAMMSEVQGALEVLSELTGSDFSKKIDCEWIADVGDHVKVGNSGGIYTFSDPSGRSESINGTLSQHNVKNGQEMVAKKYNNGFLFLETNDGDEIGWVDRYLLEKYEKIKKFANGGLVKINSNKEKLGFLGDGEQVLQPQATKDMHDTFEVMKGVKPILESLQSIADKIDTKHLALFMNNMNQSVNNIPIMTDLNKIGNSIANNSNTSSIKKGDITISNQFNVNAKSDFEEKKFANNLNRQFSATLRDAGVKR